MSRRRPKVPFYKKEKVKVNVKQPAGAKSQEKKRISKKKQKLLLKLHRQAKEVEQLINKADYKQAFKIARGIISKYTDQSIKGNDLLNRIARMAETALEYMHVLNPEIDDVFLELLGSEMEQYKDLDLYRTVERILAERLENKLKQIKDEGREKWIEKWMETWKPWVSIIKEEKILSKFIEGEEVHFKWKFKIPVEFQPGEKQDCLEIRDKINRAIDQKSDSVFEEIEESLNEAKEEKETPAIPYVPAIPVTKISGSTKSKGTFSKSKTIVDKKDDIIQEKTHKSHKKPKSGLPREKEKEEDRLRSSDVFDYLYKLKYEEGVDEAHFIKIKNGVGAFSQNKEKKLFKILSKYEEKKYIIRKAGHNYAILF